VQPIVTFREEVIRTLSRLEDDFTLVHNTGRRIGRALPMVAKSQLRH